GEPVLDVLVVGAGQGGQAIAHALQRERIANFLVIDRAPRDREGPWKTFARMPTLRSWKTVTGPDLDIPALTFQSWFEAQYGAAAFTAINKIPKGHWQDYLLWMRELLGMPVKNGVELLRVVPEEGLLAADVREDGRESRLYARKVVLAMGIEACGGWFMPAPIAALPPRFRAHSADDIDFTALRGKRVAVIGAGASAFDNGATALEQGAASVALFCRRSELQRTQPYKAISFPGFLRHFAELDDAMRWRFMLHLLDVREAFPVETWNRATRHANFSLHTGSGVERCHVAGDAVELFTKSGTHHVDFIICGTGVQLDVMRRPELAGLADKIATWGDRFAAPAGETSARLAAFPYLGPGQVFTEKIPGTAPYLADIYCYDFGATMSFGISGASINAMKYAAPRIVSSISRDLFRADVERHWATLAAYDEPEFPLTFARDALK
ncbi:MAG: NAD(P)/FAD-dependent oxidoreductase, partial [Burkholderiales bacterium]